MTRVTNFLTTVTFFLACAFAAITSDHNNTSPDSTTSANASLSTEVVCYTGGFDLWRADYSHCLRAIQLLPSGVMPGLFHTRGPIDIFNLPRSVCYKSCVVAVSLDGEPDLSTWRKNRIGASQVADACRSPGVSDLTTGGYLSVGDRGGIVISLEKYLEGPLSVGKATTGTATS